MYSFPLDFGKRGKVAFICKRYFRVSQLNTNTMNSVKILCVLCALAVHPTRKCAQIFLHMCFAGLGFRVGRAKESELYKV